MSDLRQRATAVYRFYDETDRLLYVGIAADLRQRWIKHKRSAPWWPETRRSDIEWHPDRSSAEEAEVRAIRTESPVHNVKGYGALKRRTIRIEKDLWDQFGAACAAADTDRSAVLREFIRWYIGEPDAALPKRPKPRAPE